MSALYNELDPFAAGWLRNLITAGHIATGEVDERSIEDLKPDDVAGPGQRHFFAGIGGWSYALRLAGVPDDADIWTGSCPCQPFSSAGKRGGTSDARHLWPAWFALIRECRPATIFGEQVASPDGLAWLDLVYADLERCGYAVGAANLSAAGVGAPHARHRLYFVAHADSSSVGKRVHVQSRQPRREVPDAKRRGTLGVGQPIELGDSDGLSGGRQRCSVPGAETSGPDLRDCDHRSGVASEDVDRAMGDADHWREDALGGVSRGSRTEPPRGGNGIMADAVLAGRSQRRTIPRRGSTPWSGSNVRWIDCSDGKRRPIPVEPALFPLAHGVPNRVGLLRGSGNAIVPQVAAAFIRAAEEAWRR